MNSVFTAEPGVDRLPSTDWLSREEQTEVLAMLTLESKL